VDEAVARVLALRTRAALPSGTAVWPDGPHQAAARRLALAAVTLVRDEAGLLPLARGAGAGVIEFASGSSSPVESMRNEPLGASTLEFLIGRRQPETPFLALHSSAPGAADTLDAFMAGCQQLVVATRSAVFDPPQAALLRRMAATGRPIIQLALRSPYDANLAPAISTVLLTYGDPPNGVAAAVDVLFGDAPALGRLPVALMTMPPSPAVRTPLLSPVAPVA
jgi:beta-N-acetylhexosaminidase